MIQLRRECRDVVCRRRVSSNPIRHSTNHWTLTLILSTHGGTPVDASFAEKCYDSAAARERQRVLDSCLWIINFRIFEPSRNASFFWQKCGFSKRSDEKVRARENVTDLYCQRKRLPDTQINPEGARLIFRGFDVRIKRWIVYLWCQHLTWGSYNYV